MEEIEQILRSCGYGDRTEEIDSWQNTFTDNFTENDLIQQVQILDVVEDSYAQIHRTIDEAVSAITRERPTALESIKQHNRKIVDKLSLLESQILREDAGLGPSDLSQGMGHLTPPSDTSDVRFASMH